MTAGTNSAPTASAAAPFLSRERIIAPPGWSRWLVPPAALSIHLSVGAAYSWSVFKKPLEGALGISGTLSALPFTIGIVMLGLSAAVFGTWVDRNGPRKAMFAAMCCFCGGWLVGAAGLALGQYWIVLLGYGVLGGIGWGIGYISPVSTLMKWFPDKPGMATGLAIMGFGGGALIASPWSTAMLNAFGSSTGGIAKTFLVHGIVYAVFMSLGWMLVRVPRADWRPHGWTPPPVQAGSIVTGGQVSADNAIKTPQFWLLWIVLCFNVTAGIGILEKASPIYQDYFPTAGAAAGALAAAAAGYVAMLSFGNMAGRIGWSSLSDVIGRKNAYRLYLGVGALLYLTITLMQNSNKLVFLIATIVILSFYGAGFATVPAYLRDLFGTFQVGAIHGRLLTAWSAAGILGPIIVNSIADHQTAAGKEGPALYTLSFSIMIGLLVVALVCNELIRPVSSKWHEPATDTTDPIAEEARR
ncbi:OFA family MFS transporter [Mycolicibacterium smegmatis]|uniref:L-lactate MFS transporter n=1 Tax=Mycolicibacterium smegmatis TaxID=1772 RepID=UPI001E3DE2C6|nr:OFA family MFS transporter [Mycolicibacterium smegmatis]UGU31547.1 OFA family MFS transporter [Mycolicibacterium smegmatis]ULN72451.1 OFA family MFS transporter [Mycolicibacterium smegmatis]